MASRPNPRRAPNAGHNQGIAAETLYHFGWANHRIGDAKNDKNRILESIRFNQQCASLAGNFQAQAMQNAVSLRSQYHIRQAGPEPGFA